MKRFTPALRLACVHAAEEAVQVGGYVATEHQLFGLLRDREGVHAEVLERMGIDPDALIKDVKRCIPRPEARERDTDVEPVFTPRAKRVIDLAYDEARGLNNNLVGVEHLLLGLIREGDGVAGRNLAKHGAELERARLLVMQITGMGRTDWSFPLPEGGWGAECVPTENRTMVLIYPTRMVGKQHLKEALDRRNGPKFQFALDRADASQLGQYFKERGVKVLRNFPAPALTQHQLKLFALQFPILE